MQKLSNSCKNVQRTLNGDHHCHWQAIVAKFTCRLWSAPKKLLAFLHKKVYFHSVCPLKQLSRVQFSRDKILRQKVPQIHYSVSQHISPPTSLTISFFQLHTVSLSNWPHCFVARQNLSAVDIVNRQCKSHAYMLSVFQPATADEVAWRDLESIIGHAVLARPSSNLAGQTCWWNPGPSNRPCVQHIISTVNIAGKWQASHCSSTPEEVIVGSERPLFILTYLEPELCLQNCRESRWRKNLKAHQQAQPPSSIPVGLPRSSESWTACCRLWTRVMLAHSCC